MTDFTITDAIQEQVVLERLKRQELKTQQNVQILETWLKLIPPKLWPSVTFEKVQLSDGQLIAAQLKLNDLELEAHHGYLFHRNDQFESIQTVQDLDIQAYLKRIQFSKSFCFVAIGSFYVMAVISYLKKDQVPSDLQLIVPIMSLVGALGGTLMMIPLIKPFRKIFAKYFSRAWQEPNAGFTLIFEKIIQKKLNLESEGNIT